MSKDTLKNIGPEEMLIVSMVRAARAVLGWSQPTLAERSGVSLVALARLESNAVSPRLSTVSRLKAAIADAGIQVIEGQPSGGFTLQVSGRAVEMAAESASRTSGGKDEVGE
ncbi:helix-turn-helix domain-containing protein [Stutzerimonas kunmingensis]|uniref:helix-turn-helix domain-containing protein n=1 Tax=Stutzerimonas kunmingensis TaxID=1211807 RepID=UPI00241D9D1B|nr:helix-turn-helix domain-containing protein [Stutzerimonas kunmingensis]